MANLDGNEIATTVKRSQVWQATHDGEGKTLPYMNRSFISFTFGGKKIEDFDLIAVTDGDRLSRQGYANFSDITTSYDTLDGQYYWSTHYEANTFEFKLATDGIDQKMLDKFLHWFKAGATRELILAEHPNRAALARVSAPPQLDLLPFESSVSVRIGNIYYPTKTTLYRGEITLSLIMDEPHWYSKVNILGIQDGTRYLDKWHDLETGEDVWITQSPDALKILYEDGIPLGSMIQSNMLLGDGAYASVETSDYSRIWNPTTSVGAIVMADENDTQYRAFISGAYVDVGGNGIYSLTSSQKAYFFYAGTAPAPTIITFTLTPQFNNNNNGYYIEVPKNIITNSNDPYNIITIQSETKQEFKFTTPNIYTSYNKTIQIFSTMAKANNSKYTWEDVRKEIRDNVRHAAVRAWANRSMEWVIQSKGENATDIATDSSTLLTCMKSFLTNGNNVQSATFTFNSQTGSAVGIFKYRNAVTVQSNDTEWSTYVNRTSLIEKTENVGDMVKSNYIILQDRNYPTDDGIVTSWDTDTNIGYPWYSHMIKHDCATALINISIKYKNMYL